MTPRRKRHLTYFTIGVYFFLGGVEYAVILPTVWLYLDRKFHAPRYVLGFILSAFSFSGLLASPFMGRWSDKTGNTKAILLIANLFEIVGSIMYFIGINEWFLVASRFVAGIGNGVGSAIFADISRVTSKDDRTGVMSSFMAVRQFGLIIGPGFNLFLRHLDFNIFGKQLDKYTAPGLFMALMWSIHEVLVIFLYWNLPKLKLQEDLENEQDRSRWSTHQQVGQETNSVPAPLLEPGPSSLGCVSSSPHISHHRSNSIGEYTPSSVPKTPPRVIHVEKHTEDNMCASSNEFIEGAEHLMAMTPDTQRRLAHEPNFQQLLAEVPPDTDAAMYEDSMLFTEDYFSEEVVPEVKANGVTSREQTTPVRQGSWPWKYYYDEFMREEIIAILTTVFVAFFNQCALETMTTPLTQKYLNWEELENSLLYCIAGVEILVVFLGIRFLSRKFTDSSLLLLGFLVEVATVAFITWFIPQATPGDYKENLAGIVVGIFFDLLGLPFLMVCSASLYSKITREETQGFAQGIRRVFVGCGTILGPLWAGGLMKTPNELYTMFGVMMGINGIAMVLMMLSYMKLKRQEKEADLCHTSSPSAANRSINDDSEERQPLLR